MSKLENPYDDDDIFEDDENDEDELDIDSEYDDDSDNLDDADDSDDIDHDSEYDEDDEDDSEYSKKENTKNVDSDSEIDNDDDYQPSKLKADRLESKESNDSPEIMPPFKNIPVLLNFSLGQLKMSLAELSELTEGALLPLASNDAAITIYANTKAVAKGEVVMIDERLAVQITEIYT